jgi:hypothetical protein
LKKTFQVFHSPIEIAGQMGALVGGLRQFGHTAIGYNSFTNYLKYSANLVNTDYFSIIQSYEILKPLYDILHFHFGTTLQEDLLDLPRYKIAGKKLVMHHWGNDVRVASMASSLSPYLTDPCNPWPDHVMIERLKRLSEHIPTAIIQDFELYPYVKDYYNNIYVLPLAYPVASVQPVYPSINQVIPLIIHAPTQPGFKGTAIIEATLSSLWSQGFVFEYKRIENMGNEQAMQLYRQADIVIDQISVGTYGAFAVEVMALGKPVVGYIRDDLRDKYPGYLPIVNGSPLTLQEALIPLLTDAYRRYSTGVQSRQYALDVHDISKVIPQLEAIYKVVEDT